jgi:hypothetical protein
LIIRFPQFTCVTQSLGFVRHPKLCEFMVLAPIIWFQRQIFIGNLSLNKMPYEMHLVSSRRFLSFDVCGCLQDIVDNTGRHSLARSVISCLFHQPNFIHLTLRIYLGISLCTSSPNSITWSKINNSHLLKPKISMIKEFNLHLIVLHDDFAL